MSVNPDIAAHERVPQPQDLRFIECAVDNHDVCGTPAKARILQQYQWCNEDARWGWYDIPLSE